MERGTWSSASIRRFIFTAGISGDRIDYDDSTLILNRNDEFHSYSVGIGTITFLKRGTILVSYQASHNVSNLSQFNLSSHEIELTAEYRY